MFLGVVREAIQILICMCAFSVYRSLGAPINLNYHDVYLDIQEWYYPTHLWFVGKLVVINPIDVL